MSTIGSATSGLDVEGIVNQLLYAERQPARTLERARSNIAAQETALAKFEAKLKSLSSAVEPLNGVNAIEKRSVTTSDATKVKASVSSGAQIGSYSIVIDRLATTNAFGSAGFASLEDILPTGTFDITVGSDDPVTIDVAAGSTLEDLRDSIKTSGADVKAAVVFDGSNYRLSITSGRSGLDGATTMNNFSGGSLEAALSFSELTGAQDAEFSVNGLDITRSSNRVTDVVEGLTLDLLAEASSATVDIDLDPAGTVESIRAFVDSYNAIASQMREQISKAGAAAGPLAGLSGVRRAADRLRSLVTTGVTGEDGERQSLRTVGVLLANDGTLSIDEAKLTSALESGALKTLFGSSSSTTHELVQLQGTTSSTKQGTFEVFVTQAATQAFAGASAKVPIAGIDADETLTFTQGATSVDINLTDGMTADDIVGAITAGLAGSGISLTAFNNGRKLEFTSTGYGTPASFSVVSDRDSTKSSRIGTAGLSGVGLDVAGTIGGEAATGIGRILTATTGDPSGASLEILATTADIGPGGSGLGDLIVKSGLGEQFSAALKLDLSASTGSIAKTREGLDRQDRLLEDRIESIDSRLADRQVFLTRQLSQANAALSNMQTLLSQFQAQIGGRR